MITDRDLDLTDVDLVAAYLDLRDELTELRADTGAPLSRTECSYKYVLAQLWRAMTVDEQTEVVMVMRGDSPTVH